MGRATTGTSRGRVRYKTPLRVASRTSAVANAFVQNVMPIIQPDDHDIAGALDALGSDGTECAYCGNERTDWDHLMPLVKHGQPTGYFTEPGNMIPSCGTCNQSKSGQDWRDWMLGNAAKSPTTRGLTDVAKRVAAIERFIAWRGPKQVDFAAAAGADLWDRHRANQTRILDDMRQAAEHADRVRAAITDSVRRANT